MANVRIQKVSIDRFFEFASGFLPFDLVDIVSESENHGRQNDEVSSDEFEYRTHFFVNQQVSEELGATGLRVDVFVSDPRLRKPSFTDAVASFDVKFDIAADIRRKIGQTQTNALVTRFSPNNLLKVLVSSNIRANNKPRLIIPGQSRKSTPTFQDTSKRAKKSGLDPAALASVGNFFSTTPGNAISLDSTNAKPIDQSRIKTLGSSIRSRKSLAETRRNNRSKRRGSQSNELVRSIEPPSAPSKRSNVEYISLLPKNREFIQNFCIKKSRVAGAEKIYAVVTAIAGPRAETRFETKTIEIHHARELSEFLSNPEPPTVSLVESGPARVKIRVQKTDPSLRVVRIFRISSNPNSNRTILTDVSDLTFADENVLVFDDLVDNASPNKLLYRVAVVNGDGSIGEFSSLSIPAFVKVSDPLNSAGVPISIRAVNRRGAVHIRVTTLSDDIYTMRLLRQEIDKTGEFSDSVVVIESDTNESLAFINGQIDSFEFRDETAILGKKYRYFVAYRVGRPGYASMGEEIISDEDELLIRRYTTDKIPFAVSVTEASVSQDSDNNTTVSFDIQVRETSDLFNSLAVSLRSAGVGDEFISALQKDEIKEKLFTMFLVERFEYSSGRRSTFGMFPPGTFFDNSEIRRQQRVPAPEPGERYEYIVKTCLQQPEVFLQSASVGLINRYGDEIKKAASRFSRIVYDKLGVMPSEKDVLSGKSIEDLLLESQIGQEQSVYLRIPSSRPIIESFQVTEKSFYNSLSWRVSGNAVNVSYFLVYCSHNGREQLCGAIAAGKESALYRFRDDRFFDEVGEKSYSIRAISFDDDEIIGSTPISVNKTFSVPENIVLDEIKPGNPDFSNFKEFIEKPEGQFDSSTNEKPFDWSQIDLPISSRPTRPGLSKKPNEGFIAAGSADTSSGSRVETNKKNFAAAMDTLLDGNQELFDGDNDEDEQKLAANNKSMFF